MINSPSNSAILLARLVKAGLDGLYAAEAKFFFGSVTVVTGVQVTVTPDSSPDGTSSIGPMYVIGAAVPAVGDRVLCMISTDGHISCLGAVGGDLASIGARARTTGTNSISPNTLTNIPFNTTDYDTSGLWSSGASSRLTCPRTGLYSMSGGASFVAVANGLITASGGGFAGGTFVAAGQLFGTVAPHLTNFASDNPGNFHQHLDGDGATFTGLAGNHFHTTQIDWAQLLNYLILSSAATTISGTSPYVDNDIDFTKNERFIKIVLNGSVVIAEMSSPVVDNKISRLNAFGHYFLTAGDFIQLQVQHSNASNLNIASGAFLTMHS